MSPQISLSDQTKSQIFKFLNGESKARDLFHFLYHYEDLIHEMDIESYHNLIGFDYNNKKGGADLHAFLLEGYVQEEELTTYRQTFLTQSLLNLLDQFIQHQEAYKLNLKGLGRIPLTGREISNFST